MTTRVSRLHVLTGRRGPALLDADDLVQAAGGTPANFVARWHGASWSPLAIELNHKVNVLTVFDDATGAGRSRYTDGFFARGAPQSGLIAQWDSAFWNGAGVGMNSLVNALAPAVIGSRAALYTGEVFTMPRSHAARHAGCLPPDPDLNGDGIVNGADVAILINRLGAVPESGVCLASCDTPADE